MEYRIKLHAPLALALVGQLAVATPVHAQDPAAQQPPPQPAPAAQQPQPYPAQPQPQPQPYPAQPYPPAQPGYQPAPYPPPQPAYAPYPQAAPIDPAVTSAKRTRRTGIALTAAGWSIFGASYLTALLVGGVMIDLAASDDDQARRFGRRMLIPAVGPFIAIADAASFTGAFFTGFLGIIETAGLAMGIAGAVLLANGNRRLREARGMARIPVVAPLPGGGGTMSWGMRF